MSSEEIQRLEAEERELAEKLAAIRATKARKIEEERLAAEAERKRKELEQVVEIQVEKLTPYNVVIIRTAFMRSDLLAILRATPGRHYNHVGSTNDIQLKEWEKFVRSASALPKVEFQYLTGVEEQIERALKLPAWSVSIDHTFDHNPFRIDRYWRAERYIAFHRIPGYKDYNKGLESYTVIPRHEGWRIIKLFAEYPNEVVEYSEEAQAELEKQINVREALNEIAQKEDSLDPRIMALTRLVEKDGETKPWCEHMYPYQRVGIEFGLESLELNGGMLNGDVTGLGKTWEALAISEIFRREEKVTQTLIVVKPANLDNWIREIERLTGEFPVVCRTGNPAGEVLKGIVVDRKPYVLISHDTMALYMEKPTGEIDVLTNKPKVDKIFTWRVIFEINLPDMLIIDEAHKIKNSGTYRFQSIKPLSNIKYVYPMTATPVINRTGEYWAILHMCAPRIFHSQEKFLTTYTNNGQPKNSEQLQEMLRPIFFRRLKKDVFKDLPPVNRIPEFRPLSEKNQRRYKKILDGIYESLATFDPHGRGGEEMAIMSILAQITRLKQVCAADMVEHTAELATSLADENPESGKILIFSHFKGSALKIARMLGQEAVCTVKHTEAGFTSLTAPQRDRVFEEARHNKNIRFIVTTEAACEGHNLEFCDYVIFNDYWWTPAGHEQAEGRAYGRASNPHPIDAIYMTTMVPIVEWIRNLLFAKMKIIDEAVEGVEASRISANGFAKELIEMMRASQRKGEAA